MNDFSKWPTGPDVFGVLQSIGVTGRVDINSPRVAMILAEVPAEVFNQTQRQFLADAVDTTRIYNGNGTAEIEIDEFVSLTSVSAIGFATNPGFPIADFAPVVEQSKPMTRIIRSRGSVPAFGPAAVYLPYEGIFPAGRQNISVTGKFGFGSTVPADLWGAVCGEIAYRLVQDAIFNANGRLVKWQEGEQSESYDLSVSQVNHWHEQYRQAIKNYKRPSGRRLRNLAQRMI